MIQRVLNSKNFVAFLLAAATGMTLYFFMPFPEGNPYLRLIAQHRCSTRTPAGQRFVSEVLENPPV
jgi:hypothetical protein